MTTPKKDIEYTTPTQEEIDFYIREGHKQRSAMFREILVFSGTFIRNCLSQLAESISQGFHRTAEFLQSPVKGSSNSGLIHD